MIKWIKKTQFAALIQSAVVVERDHLGGVLSQLFNSSSSANEYLNLFTVTQSSSGLGTKESVFNPSESATWRTGGSGSTPQWLQIEMKNIYLTITGYILMNYNNCCEFIKSWYLEGKNKEADSWQRIDERTEEMYGKKFVKSFTNNKLKKCTFRIFRITATDDYNSGTIYLSLNEMDFIGNTSLVPNPRSHDNCYTRLCAKRNTALIASFLIALLSDGSFAPNRKIIETQLKNE